MSETQGTEGRLELPPTPCTLVQPCGLPPFWSFTHLPANVFCGFSTRLGGVSKGAYSSLNVGGTTQDDALDVAENRRRLSASMGHAMLEWIRLEHGNQVHVVDELVPAGARAASGSLLPAADAVVTRLRGTPLTIYTADCVPLVIVDPVRGALALVHAGWRGSVLGAAPSAVAALARTFGCRSVDLLVGLGASIGPCCFEVGDEVLSALAERYPAWQESVVIQQSMASSAHVPASLASHSSPPLCEGARPRTHVDLWELNRLQLVEAGVEPARIQVSRLCTMCHQDLFFSYRRDLRVTGRLSMTACLL